MKGIEFATIKANVSYDHETGVFRWRISKKGHKREGDIAGGTADRGYHRIKIDQHTYFAHRLAWLFFYGEEPAGDIRHKDGNRGNNRISNLYVCQPK